MFRRLALLGLVAMVAVAYTAADSLVVEVGEPAALVAPATPPVPVGQPNPQPTPTPTPVLSTVSGQVVSAADGIPLDRVTVSAGGQVVVTGVDGVFRLDGVVGTPDITFTRPAWDSTTIAWPGADERLTVGLEPFIARGLRVSQQVASDPRAFAALLDMVDGTVVNTLVFDSKDRTDHVLYDTGLDYPRRIGAVEPLYDLEALIAEAQARGLYSIARITTFNDAVWAAASPETALTDEWMDAADRRNWDYPLALAQEACTFGADEIHFDFIRFPSGETAALVVDQVPEDQEARTAAISSFLTEARDRLNPGGCAVSAAIFGIVMSSETDERLGQTPEAISRATDAVSPMLYPIQYNRGWIGLASPYRNPGPVVAHALATGAGRIQRPALLRPWLQAFSYGTTEIRAQIAEVEAIGSGWVLWNSYGEYLEDWLPRGD